MSNPTAYFRLFAASGLLFGMAGAGPVWEKPSLSLGSLDGDGGLRQRFELGVLSGSPEFSLPVFLEHGFRGDDPATEYKIPQLESYVAPEGRDQILWLEPGGTRHYFKSSEILAKAPEKQKAEWVATRPSAGSYEFKSNDGWTYRYESGSICSLLAPTGRKLRFQTEGLRIRRIYQEAGGKEFNLLESKDNDSGQPESLRIGPDVHEFRYDAATQQLVEWRSPRMGKRAVTFDYSKGGLIDTVTLPTQQKLTYTWAGGGGGTQPGRKI